MILILCVCLMLYMSVCSIHAGPKVQASIGTIIGKSEKIGSVIIDKYLGIPYAEPPVGKLRFAPPEPLSNRLSQPLEATRFGYACPQDEKYLKDFSMSNDKDAFPFVSEDCLNLNIYVPKLPEDTPEQLKAVMVWIHGGGFGRGSSGFYDFRAFSAVGNVVVVSINYRLGALGFFSTGDDAAPGNYGLLDQQLALKWINDNIHAFGGDAGKITIFGESAGSASVTFQALLPNSEGLFHRVIAESGTALSHWSNPKDILEYSQAAIDGMGCTHEDTTRVVDCMRKVAFEMLNQNFPAYPFSKNFVSWGPRMDGNTLKSHPMDIVTEGRGFFGSIDLLIGANGEEGSPLMTLTLSEYFKSHGFDLKRGIPKKYFREILNRFTPYYDDDRIESALWKKYAASDKHSEDDMISAAGMNTIFGDGHFIYDIVIYAQCHSARRSDNDSGKTYFYQFLTVPTAEAYGFKELLNETDPWTKAAKHTDEMLYLYGPMVTSLATAQPTRTSDMTLARNMVLYWTNFAKTGNPNQPEKVDVEWPEFTSEEERFIRLNVKDGQLDITTNHTHPWSEVVAFWRDVLNNQKRCSSKGTEEGQDFQGKTEL